MDNVMLLIARSHKLEFALCDCKTSSRAVDENARETLTHEPHLETSLNRKFNPLPRALELSPTLSFTRDAVEESSFFLASPDVKIAILLPLSRLNTCPNNNQKHQQSTWFTVHHDASTLLSLLWLLNYCNVSKTVGVQPSSDRGPCI